MAQEASNSSLRVAARLAVGFALDLVKLGGFGRDVIDGLLLMAISQANVALITRDPDLQRMYATLDQPPPDNLRRPVSVNAIASSLHLPFETTRRRIAALIKAGVLQSTPRGVIMPLVPLNSEFYRIAAGANYVLLRTLYFRLRKIGMLSGLVRPNAPPFDPEHAPYRLVIRLSSDYFLRLVDPIILHIGDLVSGLILLDVFLANTEHLADTEGGDDGEAWTEGGFVSDADRRPVRAADIGRRLGIPHETVRRRLLRLVAKGGCERSDNGFWISSRILASGLLLDIVLTNQTNLQRLFTALAESGVLSQWEREDFDLQLIT